jgi:hypothetical protein
LEEVLKMILAVRDSRLCRGGAGPEEGAADLKTLLTEDLAKLNELAEKLDVPGVIVTEGSDRRNAWN